MTDILPSAFSPAGGLAAIPQTPAGLLPFTSFSQT